MQQDLKTSYTLAEIDAMLSNPSNTESTSEPHVLRMTDEELLHVRKVIGATTDKPVNHSVWNKLRRLCGEIP
jgi:DNA-binding transcriptional MerR regulator